MKSKRINTAQLSTTQTGFTLVELMISITVFSMLLILCTFGIVRISQAFYKGIVSASTQQIARTAIEDVTQNIQLGGQNTLRYRAASSGGGDPINLYSYCLGQVRYTFALNYQEITNSASNVPQRKIPHALWRDIINDPSNCSLVDLRQVNPTPIDNGPGQPGQAGSEGRELLGENMRLMDFVLAELPYSAGLYQVKIVVMYGDQDLIDFTSVANQDDANTLKNARCREGRGFVGAAFCARSEITTTVGKRLR